MKSQDLTVLEYSNQLLNTNSFRDKSIVAILIIYFSKLQIRYSNL